MPEIWDAYDKYRRKLNVKLVRGEDIPNGMRNLVAHMIYYDGCGNILIQRRSQSKNLAPGLWACAGGSALAGEDTIEACIRETEEEMGFVPDMTESELILSYSRKDGFTDVFLIKTEIDIEKLVLQPEEVAEARWVNRAEFEALVADGSKFWQYSYLPTVLKYLTEAEYLK